MAELSGGPKDGCIIAGKEEWVVVPLEDKQLAIYQRRGLMPVYDYRRTCGLDEIEEVAAKLDQDFGKRDGDLLDESIDNTSI